MRFDRTERIGRTGVSLLTALLLASCGGWSTPLPRTLSVRLDASGVASLEEVMLGPFEEHPNTQPNFGFTKDTVWLRVDFDPESEGPFLVEIDSPQLDHVEVHIRTRDGAFEHRVTGDRLPFDTRPLAYPTFVFPIPDDAARPFEVYARVQTAGAAVLPVRVWQAKAFTEHVAVSQLGHGFYYAFLLSLAAYNLFLFVALRERGYLYYALYLVPFVLFQASLEGHGQMWLWPGASGFANYGAGVMLLASLAAACHFVPLMLGVRGRSRAFLWTMSGVCVAVVPVLFLRYDVGIRLATSVAMVLVTAFAVTIGLELRRGSRAARYLALAYGAILPGGALLGLRMFDLAPAGFLSQNLVKMGTMLEALLLSFMLADRLQQLTRGKAEAQARLVEVQRDFSRRLMSQQDVARRSLARELHDGVGQTMLAVVSELRQTGDPGLEKIGELAADAVHEVRGLAHRLHPARLDRLGLSDAVRATAEEVVEAAGLEGELVIEDVDALVPRTAWIHLYRMAQEGMSNVVKHAEAGELLLVLRREADEVVLRIEDDGCGGDVQGDGLGLLGLRERAELIDARLHVGPGPDGRGWVLTVKTPIT